MKSPEVLRKPLYSLAPGMMFEIEGSLSINLPSALKRYASDSRSSVPNVSELYSRQRLMSSEHSLPEGLP